MSLLLRHFRSVHIINILLIIIILLFEHIIFLLEFFLVAEYFHALFDLDILPRLFVLYNILKTAPEVDKREQLATVVRMLLHLVERRVLLRPLETQIRQLLNTDAVWIEILINFEHGEAVQPLDNIPEVAFVVTELAVNGQAQRLGYLDGFLLRDDHVVLDVD